MLQSVPAPPLRRKQRYIRQQQSYQLPRHLVQKNKAEHMDLLYIVTSSNEYNAGAKATRQGQDRFLEILVPVIVESAESLMSTFRHVDVYLILGYTLRPHRQAILEQFLEPLGVGLQVWHDATPIHYDYITRTSKLGFIQERERVLARQHRYVIKDKLPYYDFVLAFEVRIHHLLTPCDPKCKIINWMPLTKPDFLHPSFANSFIHYSYIG
jgi:hypothetical protein